MKFQMWLRFFLRSSVIDNNTQKKKSIVGSAPAAVTSRIKWFKKHENQKQKLKFLTGPKQMIKNMLQMLTGLSADDDT